MAAQPQDFKQAAIALNIYQRINEVRKKVWYLRKDKSVETGGKPYKATTHDAVTALVRNHLIEHGVLVVPKLRSSTIGQVGETKNGTPIWRYEAKYDVEFVNCDSPEDLITIPTESHANDSGDKAPGKAVSYATKYAILKLFNIETGEDEESRVEPYGGAQKLSEEQALEMDAKLRDNELDVEAFLKWAKADSIPEIHAKAFSTCMKQIDSVIVAHQAKAERDAKKAAKNA